MQLAQTEKKLLEEEDTFDLSQKAYPELYPSRILA